MIKKRRLKRTVGIFLAFLLVYSYTFLPYNWNTILADEDTTSDHSGGFIVETDRVEGSMNLLGTLQGKIQIQSGTIHGLTITKRVEIGNNQESMFIKIKSGGPIPVQNLYAETKDKALPEIGGLCTPSKLGWLCMQDVKMVVTTQLLDSIVLPNATVETCYESECGPLPEVNSLSLAELEKLLEELLGDQSELEEIENGLIEDHEKLEMIKKLLEEIINEREDLINDGQIEKLVKIIEDIKLLLQNSNSNENDILTLTDSLKTQFSEFQRKTRELNSQIKEANQLKEELMTSVKEKEQTIKELDEKYSGRDLNKIQETANVYLQLLVQVKEESPVSIELPDNLTEEENHNKTISLTSLKENLTNLMNEVSLFKSKIETEQQHIQKLNEKEDNLKSKIKDLKQVISELESQLSESIVDSLITTITTILGGLLESESNNEDNATNQEENGEQQENGENTGDSNNENNDSNEDITDTESDDSDSEQDKETDEDSNEDSDQGNDDDQDDNETNEDNEDNEENEETDDSEEEEDSNIIKDLLDLLF